MPRSVKEGRNNNEPSDTESDNTYRATNGRAYTPSNYTSSPPPAQQHPQLYPNIASNRPSLVSSQLNSPSSDQTHPALLAGQQAPHLQGSNTALHQQYISAKYGQSRQLLQDGEPDNNGMAEDPPYYVQDLPRTRTLGSEYKSTNDYRKGGSDGLQSDEPVYQPIPGPIVLGDRYRGNNCLPNDGPTMTLPPTNYNQHQYFIQPGGDVRVASGNGNGFSPLRLPLGGVRGGEGWKRCSWRYCALAFIALSVVLTALTTFLAASRGSGPAIAQEVNPESHALQCPQEQSGPLARSPVQPQPIEPQQPASGSSLMERRRPHQTFPPTSSSFDKITLGENKKRVLPPYGYWNLHLSLQEQMLIHLILTVPRGTTIGLYARHNDLPTHTQHDVMQVLRGTSQREVRASGLQLGQVEVEVEELLQSGEWFLSLYNDDGDSHELSLIAQHGIASGECPLRCNGHGSCFLGRCDCEEGYTGFDCSEVVCPVLCSGKGHYKGGECECLPGYKGRECQLRQHECQVAHCNNNGHCIDGKCHCMTGFTGEFCDIVDCPHPTCTDHGWCVKGSCVCQRGWTGSDCSTMDTDAQQCLPDCNNHGEFDTKTHSCVCQPPWIGSQCNKRACSRNCGLHGRCENEACRCDAGWTGPSCTDRLCDPRCNIHGQCKNGTCVCMPGFNGRHCTIAGCPNDCSDRRHGQCVPDVDGSWGCECENGWDGEDCSVQLEMECDDGLDNDNDGLVDCMDPECCFSPGCAKTSALCLRSKSPVNVVLSKPSPESTSTFYEKMKFLIEEKSLQDFTSNLDERRASVIRGRVVTRAGRGVIGVRVNTNDKNTGTTTSRKDGRFDFMVNGGGAVTIQLSRPQFEILSINVIVPWNEVVVLDDIVLHLGKSPSDKPSFGLDPIRNREPCISHDYDLLRPVVMVTSVLGVKGDCPEQDAVLVETQAVQESVRIPGTDLNLVYHSSRARGYQSTIRIQLTPEKIPQSLRRVYLRIMLEGLLHTKVFEADPSIKYTYSWYRQNVYKQGVYGKTTARVSVGYEHNGCDVVIWEHQTVNVAAKYLTISAAGGFNIHVHHSYNFNQGILQKGDGSNKELAEGSRLVATLLGTGEQRDVGCDKMCNGVAKTSPLLSPSSLAAAPNGSLYVGDFNLIRKVSLDGNVSTVARLNESRVSYRFHITVSPLDGSVYVSDPEAHQVLKLISTKDVRNPFNNTIVFAGSGQRCLPGDRAKCGDGGPALHARLSYPKGLAMSANGDLYIADGTNIRVITADGNIHTVLGGHDHRSHWSPVPCNGTIETEQLRLRWPTELAISPLDGSLHILDDHLVLRLTPDNRVQVVAGRPLHCPSPPENRPHMSKSALLLAPKSIAFSLKGDLYVAESDAQRINRVRVIATDGHISTFAGAESRCNCRDPTCFCHSHENVLASSAIFPSISAIAVTPDDVVHISDQAGYRVRSIKSLLPKANANKEYEIYSPDTHEVFVFNRFGQHVTTRNIVTGQVKYEFAYTVKSPSGRLSIITDAAKNRIQLMRDGNGEVSTIENPLKQRINVRLNMRNQLEELVAPDGYNITFKYHTISALLSSKVEKDGSTYSYEYDTEGRLLRTVLPTGQVISLNYDLNVMGARVTVARDNKEIVTTDIRGTGMVHNDGFVKTISQGKDTLIRKTQWHHEVTLKDSPYKILEAMGSTASQMFPVLAVQETTISRDVINRYAWIYSHSLPATAELLINNVSSVILRYDRSSNSESLMLPAGYSLLNVTYDPAGHPISYHPMHPFKSATVTYNHYGQVASKERGNMKETYLYDNLLRLVGVTYADNSTISFDFKERNTKPSGVVFASGNQYHIVYDEAGSLHKIKTPRRSIYTMRLTMSIGCYKLEITLPGNLVALHARINEQGRLLSVTQPGGGTRLYEYDTLGRLRGELYGQGYTEYEYWTWGLLHRAKSRFDHDEVIFEYLYQGGLTKEMIIKYRPAGDLHKVKIHYFYDKSAHLRKIEPKIGSTTLDAFYIVYNNQSGHLQSISDLRIVRQNVLETTILNQNRHFVLTRKKDKYGRLSLKSMSLQGGNVFNLNIGYDKRDRVSKLVIEITGRQELTNLTYMMDGQLLEATGTHKWVYNYDENGNIHTSTDNTIAVYLHYDESDRVNKVGDGNIEYDSRGFIISYYQQNFEYNTRGLLTGGWSYDKRWSFSLGYDHLNRVYLYRDNEGNVTQFIYARLDKPDLITHVHYPKRGITFTLIYDDLNHLVAIDKADGRFYVATDYKGTPLAFFDTNGGILHRQRWSPFGRLVESAGERIWVGVGPWGHFREPITGIVIINGNAYHPKLLQWLTPQWQQLLQPTRHVTDVYLYRFYGNDPINHHKQLITDFHDINWWLKMTGIDLSNSLGSEYKDKVIEKPKPALDVGIKSSTGISSSLTCQYHDAIKYLQHFSFFSQASSIGDSALDWQKTPISQKSYVFGPGVLISRVNGRALINFVRIVGDGSSVIGDVIRIALNNSLLLDVVGSEKGKDTFYFIWEDKKRQKEDENQLVRLSGIFNVTKVEKYIGNGVHVATPTANLMVLYGVHPERAKAYILEELEKAAGTVAWEREARLVSAGRPTSRRWDQDEVKQLIKNGYVRGYTATAVHPTDIYPFLASDPSNIHFRHDSSRKRRKTRRKNRKKSWRRRDWSRDSRAT